MIFVMLESGALILTLMMGWEMHDQHMSWRSIVIRLLVVFSLLTAIIVTWRGL